MIPIIYHPRYNITAFGLERLHPFDSRKYRRIHDALVARGLRTRADFIRPRPVGRQELSRVHAPEYLRSLRRPAELARILEVPVARRLPGWLLDWRVLKPMRYAASGTVLACRLALEQGVAINLGGGFHHAAASWGGGFCAYADIPLACATLHGEGKVARVLVVDLDAQEGNGTASVFHDWPWAALLDLYQDDLFPFPKEPEAFGIPVRAGLGGAHYLEIVAKTLANAITTTNPDLIVYNAGSDPYVDDPLAGFELSARELEQRDPLVVTMARERSIPVAMVLSGGYSALSWRIHADSIEAILTRFDRP